MHAVSVQRIIFGGGDVDNYAVASGYTNLTAKVDSCPSRHKHVQYVDIRHISLRYHLV